MIVLGADTHKRSHTIAAVCATSGVLLGEQTGQSGAKGAAALLGWAGGIGAERVWAIEDCRHVWGSLERFLIERGECVLRVHSTLMSASRRQARGRGKSDSIDALAVARAGLREGLDRLPAAHLDGPELDLRLLVDHRGRLVRQRPRGGPAAHPRLDRTPQGLGAIQRYRFRLFRHSDLAARRSDQRRGCPAEDRAPRS
jgi:transposase